MARVPVEQLPVDVAMKAVERDSIGSWPTEFSPAQTYTIRMDVDSVILSGVYSSLNE